MISVRAIEIDLYCCNTYMIFRFSVVLVFTWLRKSDFFFFKKQASASEPLKKRTGAIEYKTHADNVLAILRGR